MTQVVEIACSNTNYTYIKIKAVDDGRSPDEHLNKLLSEPAKCGIRWTTSRDELCRGIVVNYRITTLIRPGSWCTIRGEGKGKGAESGAYFEGT